MRINETVGAVLREKGSQVLTVSPETSVFEAIRMMADADVGALLVVDDGELLGVLSEREYTRNVALEGRSSKTTRVDEVLNRSPVTVTRGHEVAECMRLMTKHRTRHLPVVENGRVIGVVSIGDVVRFVISAQEATIHQLENYITGTWPA